jgi:hypothetical protein
MAGEETGVRLAADSKGVRMMTDVACFCGCLYSFDGDAGACPRCGEVTTVRTAAASGALDLQMLVIGGHERTQAEYHSLLDDAGYELTQIVPTSASLHIIEGIAH